MTDEVPLGRVRAAVHRSLTAELATVRDDRPATVPVTPTHDPDRGVLVVSAAPAFAGKAERAAANGQVSLLLHGADGRLLVSGEAAVDDADLEANAARLERLLRAEPPSDKRAAMLEAVAFMKTRPGLLLLDWYGLRILIEIDPVDVRRYPEDGGDLEAPPWPAADVGEGEAAGYDRAVATVVDEAGWPVTWPLSRLEIREDVLTLEPPEGVAPRDGQPACVLLHWHDEALSSLEQRLVRGRCRVDGDEVRFEPASSEHLRNRTRRDALRFVLVGKRRTRRYFADRGRTYRGWPGWRALLGW